MRSDASGVPPRGVDGPPERQPAATGPQDIDGLPPPGPPGGRVFTLEDRPAPGLYLVAWLLAVAGIAVLVVGGLAQDRAMALVLGLVGLTSIGLGLAAAAGYQVLARRDRHPAAYRGPSPVIVFGVALTSSAVVAGAGFGLGLAEPTTPLGFLGSLTVVALGYAASVWFLVVRTGALSWVQMGWPARAPRRAIRLLGDVGYAIALTIPATFALLIFATLVGQTLGVEAPDVLPVPRTSVEAFAVAAAAAFVAPVGEELFFRGFAVSAWQRDLGPRSALVRSSFFFALVHIANIGATTFREGAAQAVLQLVVIFPLALLLGMLFQQRGIVASIAGHISYNGLLLVLLFVTSLVGTPSAG